MIGALIVWICRAGPVVVHKPKAAAAGPSIVRRAVATHTRVGTGHISLGRSRVFKRREL